jgi:hypothetical protein
VQRQAADRHRQRDDPLRLLILDEVIGPRMLVVVERALAVLAAVLDVEDRAAGFDDRDARVRAQLRQLQREHRRRDPAADDADIGFVNGHKSPAVKRCASLPACAS